ncbi:MAG: cytidine deaminase [Sphingobacteriia bacterium]|nr:cytidine deaminase [Sphingobacteriia bacterium]
MTEHQYSFRYLRFASASELPEDEQKLLEQAFEASKNAYAPYSGFNVGAAVALADGTCWTGNNQENGAYPSGLCAERTALFALGAAGKATLIRKIAVRAFSNQFTLDTPAGPCGACRQVMLEYEKISNSEWVILLQGERGDILKIQGVASQLLPFSFDLNQLSENSSSIE